MKRDVVGVVNLSMFDPFEILGLQKSYALDSAFLEKRYFEEQRKNHPDRFALASEEDKKEALRKSTELNQAYLLLKDPLGRAEYLLKVKNIDLIAHDAPTLGKAMMWNERLVEGEDLSAELQQEQKNLSQEIIDGFECEDFEKVRLALYRQTYVMKLLKELKA